MATVNITVKDAEDAFAMFLNAKMYRTCRESLLSTAVRLSPCLDHSIEDLSNIKMGALNTKTPSASQPTCSRPAAVVGTIEAPRGHDIGPSHTAQVTNLNNKMQRERTALGAIEGQMRLLQKEKDHLCLKAQRLDRQLERARAEHDVEMMRQYVEQEELRLKHVEDRK